jgi:hypothetical protein
MSGKLSIVDCQFFFINLSSFVNLSSHLIKQQDSDPSPVVLTPPYKVIHEVNEHYMS